MSFYGDIKRVDSSPFVFDRIYPNRAAMEAAATLHKINDISDKMTRDDDVYIGRYVLVKYTTYYDENGILKIAEKYKSDGEFTDVYNNNVNADKKYGTTYDSTVWQRVFLNNNSSDNESIPNYILVAELNSHSPKFTVEAIAPKSYSEDGSEWNDIEVKPVASTNEEYKFQVPDTLKLEIGDIDFGEVWLKQGLSSSNEDTKNAYLLRESIIRKSVTPTFSEEIEYPDIDMTDSEKVGKYLESINKINTTYIPEEEGQTSPGDKIIGEKIDISFPAFGALLSKLADDLYGVDRTEIGLQLGEGGLYDFIKQFKNINYVQVKSSDSYDPNTIYYIKNDNDEFEKVNINEDTFNADKTRYYTQNSNLQVTSNWCSIEENSSNFIVGIPQVISNSTVATTTNSVYYGTPYINWETGKLSN